MRVLLLLCLVRAGRSQDTLRRSTIEYRPARARAGTDRPAGFGAVVPGLGLSLLAGAFLWHNEGRAVRESRMLSRVLRHVVRLDSSQPLDPAHDDALVHLSGPLRTDGAWDPDFPTLHRPDALRLRRVTEVYQWQEERQDDETRISPTEVKGERLFQGPGISAWRQEHSPSKGNGAHTGFSAQAGGHSPGWGLVRDGDGT
jgi:hypothetical protein